MLQNGGAEKRATIFCKHYLQSRLQLEEDFAIPTEILHVIDTTHPSLLWSFVLLFSQNSLFNSNRGFYKQCFYYQQKRKNTAQGLDAADRAVSRKQRPQSATGFKEDTYLQGTESCADAAGTQRLWRGAQLSVRPFRALGRLNESPLHYDSKPHLLSSSSSPSFWSWASSTTPFHSDGLEATVESPTPVGSLCFRILGTGKIMDTKCFQFRHPAMKQLSRCLTLKWWTSLVPSELQHW